MRQMTIDELHGVMSQIDTLIAAMKSGQELFPAESPEQRRRREEHNSRVLAGRQRVADAKQARENAREVAKARKACCPSCFTTLPATGVCDYC